MNLSKEEKERWILKNCIDENGDVDLKDLDFRGKNVYTSRLRANNIYNVEQKGTNRIDNECQQSNNIYNNRQEGGLIYNYEQISIHKIDNNSQKANHIDNRLQKAKKIYN